MSGGAPGRPRGAVPAPAGAAFRTLGAGRVVVLWYPRAVLWSAILLLGLLALMALGLATGSKELSPEEIIDGLLGGRAAGIVRDLRLPRVVAAVFVGAALGISGAIFQSTTRNTLGSPDLIGVTSGAALGAVIGIVVLEAGQAGATIGALVGCVVIAATMQLLTTSRGRAPGQRLVLVGIGVAAFVHAFTALILTHGAQPLAIMGQRWLTGTLSGRTWAEVLPVLLGVLALAPVVAWLARHLNALEAGDDVARQAGVAVERTRLTAIAAAVALAALAVVAAGPIGFIALAAPQAARALSGTGTMPLAPAALSGAVALLGADLIGQRLPDAWQMPVGIAAALLGGLYLAAILAVPRRAHR